MSNSVPFSYNITYPNPKSWGEWSQEKIEGYFFCGKTVKVIQPGKVLLVEKEESLTQKIFKVAIGILTAGIIPLFFLLAKAMIRSRQSFEMMEKSSKPSQYNKEERIEPENKIEDLSSSERNDPNEKIDEAPNTSKLESCINQSGDFYSQRKERIEKVKEISQSLYQYANELFSKRGNEKVSISPSSLSAEDCMGILRPWAQSAPSYNKVEVDKENREEAFKRIKDVHTKKGKILNLSNLALRSLPINLKFLESVEEIDIRGNGWTEEWISKLDNFLPPMVKKVSMDFNRAIPPHLFPIIEIERAYFYEELANFSFVNGLIDENRFQASKKIIEAMVNRSKELDLSNLRLTALPNYLSELVDLRELHITGNPIRSFPRDLSDGASFLQKIYYSPEPGLNTEGLPTSFTGKFRLGN